MSKALIAAACLALAATFTASACAQTVFVKSAGIPGSSTQAGRTEWVEAEAVQEGFALSGNSATAGAARAPGKAIFKDITITKMIDTASIKLREYAVAGKPIPTVEIEVVRADQRLYQRRHG